MHDFTKTVLVTRPKDQASEFASLLESHEIRVLHLPMIEIKPPDSWQEVIDAIAILQSYDGIIFTSVNAVKYFFDRITESNFPSGLLPACYAVGEKTRKAVDERGGMCVTVPEKYNAQSLTSSMKDVAGKKFLFPQSNIGSDEIIILIEQAGGAVHKITVYQTVMPSISRLQKFEEMFLEGEVDCIAFFSPSAVKNFTTLFPQFKQATILAAAIGGTTASTALAHGLRVDVIAPQATSESLAQAIINRLQSDDRIELEHQFISDDI